MVFKDEFTKFTDLNESWWMWELITDKNILKTWFLNIEKNQKITLRDWNGIFLKVNGSTYV
jgi:hypothetical protein